MNIVIVKTSSLGDIIQSMPVLNYLQSKFPQAKIDWVVEETLSSVVASHPCVHKAIPIPFQFLKKNPFSFRSIRYFFRSLKNLRGQKYDLLFDLQANCKSGFLTFVSKAKEKVGFDRKSVREWPNVFFTHTRFPSSKNENIRLQYLSLIQKYFQDANPIEITGSRFLLSPERKTYVHNMLQQTSLQTPMKIMVCPGSKWMNKQLESLTWMDFLQRIAAKYPACFLFVWGSLEEKQFCDQVSQSLNASLVAGKLEIPTWQYLMNEMDLVIAVDSSALHLSGTTQTRSFSIFGPTSANIFKPLGNRHFAFQGSCPYGKVFLKQCPKLRTCETGACIRELSGETLYTAFQRWWDSARIGI